jgi:hypothetical protein
MRIALSTLSTKIFPSPIWPAFVADAIALTILSTRSLRTATSILIFGRKLTAGAAACDMAATPELFQTVNCGLFANHSARQICPAC